MSKRKPFNPFYILLLFAGLAFAITACAYGVMTVRQLQSSRVGGEDYFANPIRHALHHDFDELVDRYGANAMIVELLLLGVGTFGAIAYDQHLDKREAATTQADGGSDEGPPASQA